MAEKRDQKKQRPPSTHSNSKLSFKPRSGTAGSRRQQRQRDASISSDKACVVCYRDVDYHSVGTCEHSVCYECSARMRVLLEQNECPICRKSLDHVIFTHGMKTYAEVSDKIRRFIFLPKFGIYLEDEALQTAFDTLLEHKCSLCGDHPSFPEFQGLREHIQRKHELFACDLCVEHIKHFSKERKFYTRSDLAYHKRKGDRHDTSHRGHPLCKFCDRRFFDSDELFKHLRRDHYYCHFCDADGFNHYYNTYDDLRIHYRKEHFLCEEENCAEEKFTSVFRTDIDLKAHLASAHSRLLGKHGMKQARTLDIEFGLPKRPENERGRFGRPFGARGRDHEKVDRRFARDRDDGGFREEEQTHGDIVQVPSVQPKIDLSQDFPTLDGGNPGESASNSLPTNGASMTQKLTSSSRNARIWNGKTKQENDFPALDGCSVQPIPLPVAGPYSRNKTRFPESQRQTANLVKEEEDFPCLSASAQVRPTGSKVWSGPRPPGVQLKDDQEPRKATKGKKIAPCPILEDATNDDFNFVPLHLPTRNAKGNGTKTEQTRISPMGDTADAETEDVEPSNSTKKGKKKSQVPPNPIAVAAAALFNGGGSAPPKVTAKPPIESVEEFPSLPLPVSKRGRQAVTSSKKNGKAQAPPQLRKISPPPGFQLKKSEENNENNTSQPVEAESRPKSPISSKPPPGFEGFTPGQPQSLQPGLSFLNY